MVDRGMESDKRLTTTHGGCCSRNWAPNQRPAVQRSPPADVSRIVDMSGMHFSSRAEGVPISAERTSDVSHATYSDFLRFLLALGASTRADVAVAAFTAGSVRPVIILRAWVGSFWR